MNTTELYLDINKHLLHDEIPSQFINHISQEAVFIEQPFSMLNMLKKTEQSPKHHPEGNVWNHTMLVINEAAKIKNKSKDAHIFMWAALLHDIGKPSTTKNKNGKITSYDHDKVGEKLAREFLEHFTTDNDFINAVTALIRWHMQILFVVNNLPFADIETMKRHTNVHEVALLGLCDRMGRLHGDLDKEQKNIEQFLEKCE